MQKVKTEMQIPEWGIKVIEVTDHGMIVGARQGGLSISETADLLGFLNNSL